MDTSKEYIKMCDCPEIQEQWETTIGDFYFVRDGLFRPTNIVDVYNGGGYAVLPKDANYGWLPRQDQIQEKLGCGDIQVASHRLYQVANFWIGRDLRSLEQLWLAFYMWEKHKKAWNGEKWVR